MFEFDRSKQIVWQAMDDASKGKITQEEFNKRMKSAEEPLDFRQLASNLYLSHNGLCIRGGLVEKILERLKII